MTLQASWRVVRLWELDAADVLARGEVGALPWVPLMRFDGPAEELVRDVRDRIERSAPPDRLDGLLSVTKILASMVMDEAGLMALFGRMQKMLDIPLLNWIREEGRAEGTAETVRRMIARALTRRFGAVPADVAEAVNAETDAARLDALLDEAVDAPDLAAFAAALVARP